MRRSPVLLCLLLLLVGSVRPAASGIPDPTQSSATSAGGTLYITSTAAGENLSDDSAGATITVTSDIPDPTLSSATSAGGTLYITPTGGGENLSDNSVGATITVTVLDSNGSPIANYPFQDVWPGSHVFNALSLCNGGASADGNTNAEGRTTISGPIAGGGHTQSGLRVFLAGTPITGTPALPIHVNSPDINADRRVDLCDLALFADDFFNGYDFRSDFRDDSALGIQDIGILYAFYGDGCDGTAPPRSVAAEGRLGIYFDAAGTQTALNGVTAGSIFNVYVVASGVVGMTAYEFEVDVDPALIVVNQEYEPSNFTLTSSAEVRGIVGTAECFDASSTTLLATYQVFALETAENLQFCLGPVEGGTVAGAPGWVGCGGTCAVRSFDVDGSGCIVVNGVVPTETTTWGSMKGRFGSDRRP